MQLWRNQFLYQHRYFAFQIRTFRLDNLKYLHVCTVYQNIKTETIRNFQTNEVTDILCYMKKKLCWIVTQNYAT